MKTVMAAVLVTALAGIAWADQEASGAAAQLGLNSSEAAALIPAVPSPKAMLPEISVKESKDKGLFSPVYNCTAKDPADNIRSFVLDMGSKQITIVTPKNPAGVTRDIQCKNNSTILGTPVLFCAIKGSADQVYLFRKQLGPENPGTFNATYVGLEEHQATCTKR